MWVFHAFKFSGYNNEDFPEGNIQDAKNYCRNPGKEYIGPWCYIRVNGEIIWEECHIPYCERDSELYLTLIFTLILTFHSICSMWKISSLSMGNTIQ